MTTTALPALEVLERQETLVERIYAELRHALLIGSFSPGQRVTIRALASAMNVSPTPAREALGRLVAEGVLEFGPNRTVYVPEMTRERLHEIYRLRIALEGLVTAEATPKLSPKDVDKLAKIQDELVAAMDAGDYKGVLRVNERFHFLVYEASGMPLAVKMIEGLWLRMGPILNLLYPEYDRTRQGVSNHQSLIAALRKGDAAAASAAIQKDLADGERRLMTVVDRNAAEAAPSAKR